MKQKSLILLVMVLGIIASGCSYFGDKNGITEKPTSNTSAKTVANETVDTNVNSQNVSSDNTTVDYTERTNRRRRVVVDPSSTPPPPPFTKAAEDSESAVTMDSEGSILEIRIFNSHPQILKVEATRLDETSKLLKVFLRNGTIVEIKTDKVQRLETIKSTAIMEIAGIPIENAGAGRTRIAGQN